MFRPLCFFAYINAQMKAEQAGMDQHLSHATLVRYLAGKAADPEAAKAIAHLASCATCRAHAPEIISDLASALAEAERSGLSQLMARARWAELTCLPTVEQISRIKARKDHQTQEMFDTVLKEASILAQGDPFVGEQAALVAYALAENLSDQPEALRNDLQGAALVVVANCRRLGANWRGCNSALKAARRHLERGTGEPAGEAKLLSIQASLATDTGHLPEAEALLARASALFHQAGAAPEVAAAMVQEANLLLAGFRYEQAIARAQEVLRLLSPRDTRLKTLARNIITMCLVCLGRPIPALNNYLANRTCDQGSGTSDLQSSYLVALLLDAFGHPREAEMAFRRAIAGFMNSELYKDAFLIMLHRFDRLVRRGAFDQAARACEEAIGMCQQADVSLSGQLEELWRSLLTLIQARRLTNHQLNLARRCLGQHWNSPAQWITLFDNATETILEGESHVPVEATSDLVSSVDSPSAPASHEGQTFDVAMDRFDRDVIVRALAHCRGRATEVAHRLGIARGTLRAKMKTYGLSAGRLHTTGASSQSPQQIGEVERKAIQQLRTKARWQGLKLLSPTDRKSQLKNIPALKKKEFVETILDEASVTATSDPRVGEELASAAYDLATSLPQKHCASQIKHDLQCKAAMVTANCQRLAGDWQGSTDALTRAQAHRIHGSGDIALETQLLSIRASLATDTGRHNEALTLLVQISTLYRIAGNSSGTAFTAIQEANSLLAAYRHSEALNRAMEAVSLLSPEQRLLEILARNIVTACLVFLGQPREALLNHVAGLPLTEEVGGPREALQRSYLEALILEAFGYEQEAEALFNASISARLDAGLGKDALLIMLARYENLFKRGYFAKAARFCEEAVKKLMNAEKEYHAQAIQLWRDLLALVDGRQLTDLHLVNARQALLRCWAPPASRSGAQPAAAQDRRRLLFSPPPPLPARPSAGECKSIRALYERSLIEEALVGCEGRFGETCEALGMNPKTLRSRLRKYGLKTGPARSR